MLLKFPKEEKIYWTKHSKMKLRQYRLSEKRILRILRKPDRIEEGIAPKTVAAMQIAGTKKHPKEIWTMYQIIKSKLKNQKLKVRIISAWRYPGRSPINKPLPIPKDILIELNKIIKYNKKAL